MSDGVKGEENEEVVEETSKPDDSKKEVTPEVKDDKPETQDADGAKGKPDDKSLSDEDDNGGIDWLTIVLMVAVMANIGYWIWVRDTIITGDVEMHRPPGVGVQAVNDPNAPSPGPNEGQDDFGRIADARHDGGDPEQQDLVRTYIVIANALEISGYGEVRTVWELDKQVMEAARNNAGREKEMELTKQAYNETLKIMRESYQRAFLQEANNVDATDRSEAETILREAQSLNDIKPLEAMSRYEDALLRLRASHALRSRSDNNHEPIPNDYGPRGNDRENRDNPKVPGYIPPDHSLDNPNNPQENPGEPHHGPNR